jgi:hypothetical protein
MKAVTAIALALLGSAAVGVITPGAHASTLTFPTLTINGPNSTSATCSAFGVLTTPVPVNTVLCTVTVLPAGWSGVVANPLGGADSAKFFITTSNGTIVLENNVQLTNTGSAAATGTYAIGSSTVTP